MPKYQGTVPAPTDVFAALADPTRAGVVQRLSIGPTSVSALAEPFDMALPSFMQHLKVLEDAGLARSHKAGRVRMYQLVPGSFDQARSWLSNVGNHWERRLDALDHLLTEQETS